MKGLLAFMAVTAGLTGIAHAYLKAGPVGYGHWLVTLASPPLDNFTVPAAAYSMRRLKSTYTGPAIRLRRASDNLEQDINFLSFTSFTGAPIDTVAANAHCAATTCYAAKWYDQSGNTRDVAQAVAADQPAYIPNCQGSLPCLRVTTPSMLLQTAAAYTVASPMSLSVIHNRRSGTGTCQPLFLFYNYIYGYPGANGLVLRGIGEIIGNAADGAFHAAMGVIGPSAIWSVDGTDYPGTAAIQAGSGVIGVGYTSPAGTTCDLGEAVLWNGYGLAANERSALTINQRSFWGTP